MFEKVGDAKPLDLIHTCCKCEMSAIINIDGKYYCNKCRPETEISTELEEEKNER